MGTFVNPQVTDAITQINSLSIGEGPSLSMALVSEVMAETMGMVMHNAVTAQGGMQVIAKSATTVVCALIISKGAMSS